MFSDLLVNNIVKYMVNLNVEEEFGVKINSTSYLYYKHVKGRLDNVGVDLVYSPHKNWREKLITISEGRHELVKNTLTSDFYIDEFSEIKNLHHLDLRGAGLNKIPHSFKHIRLHTVNLLGNNITNANDLKHNAALYYVDLRRNPLIKWNELIHIKELLIDDKKILVNY